jgi:hypothetical protein
LQKEETATLRTHRTALRTSSSRQDVRDRAQREKRLPQSGKSSIVRAGLIPALWRGGLDGSER